MSRALATTIKSQIQPMELCAIGATKFVALKERDAYLGGLQFNASFFGRKNCKVIILLHASDTYHVAVYAGRSLKYVGGAKDVYAEDLTGIVVELVEGFFKS
jgi:hypothetical protein